MLGFYIIDSKTVCLSEEQALEFCELNRDDESMSNLSLLKLNLMKFISEKPIFAICVAKLNAIDDLKVIFKDPTKWNKQLFHFSEHTTDVVNELQFFFPKLVQQDVQHVRCEIETSIREFLDKHVFSVLVRSLVDVAACRQEENVDLYTLVIKMANNDLKRPIVSYPHP